ncbi:MAG: TIGR04282 family arsenosugar biosynthesis glycosyltransferase [Syntrophomonadaceae bacterium]|nr:TIGR04282 family arsenosugar biosynthesis glycosyltransferase [Syntrophomonadaceae bacterium]
MPVKRHDAAVVVMSKIPRPGFTKTRLNTVLTEQESADFHRASLADTCRVIMQSGLPGYIYYAEQDKRSWSAQDKHSWSEQDIWGLPEDERNYFKLYPQWGKDLGERIYHAAREILFNYDTVLFLGSDMPHIDLAVILEAKAKLLSNEIVIGPAQDGGYYLLGIKQATPDIFKDIPWGTPRVLEKTLNIIKKKNFKFSLLPMQADIDTWDDILAFYLAGVSDEHEFYRKLTSYKMAAALVRKYSP